MNYSRLVVFDSSSAFDKFYQVCVLEGRFYSVGLDLDLDLDLGLTVHDIDLDLDLDLDLKSNLDII